MLFKSVLACVASLAALPTAFAAQGPLVRIYENFGPNPTNVMFWIYVPKNLAPNPPILVNPHWCGGTGQSLFTASSYANNADTYGYIVIYPEAAQSSKCWDLSSPGTLKHDAGGDSLGVASMVRWTLKKYNANARRVFVTGASSGAMMTNQLLAVYPELFAAGSAWAGVPYGCYAGKGVGEWSNACANGEIIRTGAQWKALVESAYPGYTGWRPKLQTAHGSADAVVRPQNFQEQIKQWTAVFGYPSSPIQTINNQPYNGWTTSIYGEKFQAMWAPGVTHSIQQNENTIYAWLDLKCRGDNCYQRPASGSVTTARTTTTKAGQPTTMTTRATTAATTGGPVQGVNVPKYGQCGGNGYTGSKNCESGSTCKWSNEWYSQCL